MLLGLMIGLVWVVVGWAWARQMNCPLDFILIFMFWPFVCAAGLLVGIFGYYRCKY